MAGMGASMSERTAGTLTVADLGKSVRIEHNGWVHIGEIRKAEHTTWSRGQIRTWVGLTYESGATWFQLLEPDHVIEFRDDEEAKR